MKALYILFAVVFYSISSFFLYKGHDKLTNYNNPKIGFDFVNAYVGGDSYNYIINASQATGFFVLATLFVILGSVCLIINKLCDKATTTQAIDPILSEKKKTA